MNATRKATLIGAIKTLRVSLADAEGVRDELQEAYDEMSEKAQEGERGQALYEEIQALEQACDAISEGTDNLEGLLS